MNLNDIVGGTVNRFGGIERADYQPSPFSIENSGTIREGYRDTGFRAGSDGNIRDGYGNLTDLRINSFGSVQRERSW